VIAAGAQNPPEIVVLFDFTKGSALVAAAASLINCRKNQRNAQVLDFASDFWVSVGALAERLTLLREIEAGKAAIAARQDPRHRNAEQLSGRPERDTQKEQ
jgi:hypothetical protein